MKTYEKHLLPLSQNLRHFEKMLYHRHKRNIKIYLPYWKTSFLSSILETVVSMNFVVKKKSLSRLPRLNIEKKLKKRD